MMMYIHIYIYIVHTYVHIPDAHIYVRTYGYECQQFAEFDAKRSVWWVVV